MTQTSVKRTALSIAISVAILIVSLIVVTGIGTEYYSPSEIISALRDGPNGTTSTDVIVWTLRLPRIALGALVGASLATAGLVFQTLLRNDLADPYIVGVSSGASVGSELVLVQHGTGWLRGLAAPLAAFAGAMGAMLIVYGLGRRGGRVQVATLLLAGVVASSFFGAIATLILELGNPDDTLYIINRLMGSITDATFGQCALTAVFLVIGFLAVLFQARSMNIYALGEEQAGQLGLETERFKTTLIAVGALLTAIAVSQAGIIGFVGLVVPHIARRLCGTPDLRRVAPICTLVGAILLVWSDAAARSIMPDHRELPVGLVTAFLGAPFFLFLLRRQSPTQ